MSLRQEAGRTGLTGESAVLCRLLPHGIRAENKILDERAVHPPHVFLRNQNLEKFINQDSPPVDLLLI